MDLNTNKQTNAVLSDNVLCQHPNSCSSWLMTLGEFGFKTRHFSGSEFLSLNEIPKSNYSNGSYLALLSCGAFCYAVRGGSNF